MILFFHGEETFQSLQAVAQLKKKFLEKNPTGGGMVIFNCDENFEMGKIIQSFGEQNLFAQKKLIIIENFFAVTKAPEQKELIEKLEQNDDSDVIMFVEKGKVRKNAALFKWLHKNAQTVKEYLPLEGNALEQWIVQRVQKNGIKITDDAVRELILFVGNNLWKLSTEIEKLICYVEQEDITIENVHMLVHGKVDADMFQMIEAVASNNKSLAITLLNKQIIAGDDLFHIFSMYVYQVRILLRVGSMVEEGIRDKGVIAKELKLHPFVVQKTIEMSNNLSYSSVIKMHNKLTKIDFDAKLGNCDIESALNMFIIKT